MDLLGNYLLFLFKAITFVVVIFMMMAMALTLKKHNKRGDGELEIENINDALDELKERMEFAVFDEKKFKKIQKKRQKEQQQTLKERQKNEQDNSDQLNKKRLFLLSYDGDMRASGGDELEKEITAILQLADTNDEVLIKIETGGGVVHGYGLASSQLARLKKANIPLTVAVDKIAASGGYMMACVADKIIAAPFAIVGSIGVIAQIPNFNRLLKKHDIDLEMYMAGEHKRTLTLFGENTQEGRAKFQQELNETHVLFKDFIENFRPQVNLEEVATGEHWYGTKALDLHLIDQVMTSAEYLMSACEQADVYSISFEAKKSMSERLGFSMQALVKKLVMPLSLTK